MKPSTAIYTLAGSSLLLAACAHKAPVADPDNDAKHDVDVVSPGVALIIKREGQVALDDPRLSCAKERPIGSNMIQHVCMTKKERKQIARQAQQALMDIQDRQRVLP